MLLDQYDQELIEALEAYAKGGATPKFPFDDMKFTIEEAAKRIRYLLAKAEGRDQ